MKTLVGSLALAKYIPTVKPKDIDYFSSTDISGAEVFYAPELERWGWKDTATLDELYTIKLSHIFWVQKNGSWDKHKYYLQLMKNHEAKYIPELFDILYPIWEQRYGKKRVNLNKTADEFFSSTVDRIYDHDSIHESISDPPMFMAILRDGSEVAVSRDKFEALTPELQLRTVREELYATALERIVIPNDYKGYSRAAYDWALKQMITSFSKGWFATYVADHLLELNRPDIDFVKVHLENKHKLRIMK